MKAQLAPHSSVLEEVRAAVRRHAQLRFAFFTTYTFDATFFEREFLPLLVGEYGEREHEVSTLVVCDRHAYRGHRAGPWVSRWPEGNLFHPKVTLLVFEEATVLLAGSANLTVSGQYENLEIVGMRSWPKAGLPRGLLPFVKKLEGPTAAALRGLDVLPSPGFVTSLEERLGNRFGGPAGELVVVSPFFDRKESAEPDDLGFIVDACARVKPKVVRLLLPVTRDATGRSVVPIARTTLKALRDGRELDLRGYDAEKHGKTLHAKVIALTSGARTSVLMGSANATRAAMESLNVEAGWWLTVESERFAAWLPKGERLKCDEVRTAVPPSVKRAPSAPAGRAVFDAGLGELRVAWERPRIASGVELRYEGHSLQVRGGKVKPFQLGADWYLRTRKRGYEDGYMPIELDDQLAGWARPGRPRAETADEMLAQLGAAPDLEREGTLRSRGGAASAAPAQEGALAADAIYARSKRLAAQMRAAESRLAESAGVPSQQSTAKLLVEAARASDPARFAADDREGIWAFWVRAEIARILRAGHPTPARRDALSAVARMLRTSARLPVLDGAGPEIARALAGVKVRA